LALFRANLFMDRKGTGAVFRVIPSNILTAEQLGLSPAILNLCKLNKGLVLVTGPTGSGKSTTLCGMIDYINRTRQDHLITIEDPIEFVHENKMCAINQREVHNHTMSFKNALRAALREDPDIILVGEMRDLETVAIAIETAETGHLVFGTLHTTTAASTVDRVIDQFPTDRQAQIRIMLSESLKGVISQTLCKKIGARGADRDLGREQPDPRGEDLSDPVADASRQSRGDGDAERRADGAGDEEGRPARRGVCESRRQGWDGNRFEACRLESHRRRTAGDGRRRRGSAGADVGRSSARLKGSRSSGCVGCAFSNRRAIFVRFCRS
jgi:type II secretory ATPase GspE/PulE/Tfp pilus assembly ATPase PilB-like protein